MYNIMKPPVAKLSTDHICVIQIPAIITDCTPLAKIVHLYASFVLAIATNQSYRHVG